MNPDVPDTDASIVYYDGDYPSLEIGTPRPEDVTTLSRVGILGDVPHYKAIAAATGGPVLEIGCGTGRLAIPLARQGHAVWAVDVSEAMLDQMRAKCAREEPAVRDRLRPVCQDAAALDLPERGFALAVIPFNVFMLIGSFDAQRRTLAAVARHLVPGGVLALDVMNPLVLSIGEEKTPHPSEPRRNPHNGRSYIKNSLNTRIDERQVQRLYGWYDELLPDGTIKITDFSFRWRIVFRYELELMLNEAGFDIDTIHGDFEGAAWTVDSGRIVATARRRAA